MRKPLFRDAERKYIPKRGVTLAYRDFFDARDARQGPLVLKDCTSVEWPKGWGKEDAIRWRRANSLEKPGQHKI